MLIDINQKLNLQELDRAIDRYQGMYQQDPYIFVNEETSKAMQDTLLNWDYHIDMNKKCVNGKVKDRSYMVWKYHDNKVYYNDDLKFGEVELR